LKKKQKAFDPAGLGNADAKFRRNQSFLLLPPGSSFVNKKKFLRRFLRFPTTSRA
jgi:hypothetical protein